MNKEVSFSRHAKNRMRLHRLTEQEVVFVLASPDYIENDVEGRENFWEKVDNQIYKSHNQNDSGSNDGDNGGKEEKGVEEQ